MGGKLSTSSSSHDNRLLSLVYYGLPILTLTLTTERMNMVRHKLKRCSRELTGMNNTAQPEEGE